MFSLYLYVTSRARTSAKERVVMVDVQGLLDRCTQDDDALVPEHSLETHI